MQEKTDTMNLSKFLANAGLCSRRGAADLVASGAIAINGTVADSPGARVSPQDKVTIYGRPVKQPEAHVYIMLHKPRGYICTNSDPHAKKKAIDLIEVESGVRLVSAGRLDKDSEGLILFSNDGAFIDKLTHPRYRIRKIYEVSLERPLSEADMARFAEGIQDSGETLKAESIEQTGESKYRLILAEGKNREIRRMVEAVRNRTKRLKRVGVGNLKLGGLDVGEWKYLSGKEAESALAEIRK